MQEKNHLKELKLGMTVMLITMLCVVTAVAFIYKNGTQQLQQKDYKISMLMNEIGEIKDQNEKLHQSLKVEKANLQVAVQGVHRLNDSFDDLGASINEKNQNYQQDIQMMSQVQVDLQQTKVNLLDLVSKKERVINDLKTKNKKIAQLVTNGQHEPGYFNILLLGQHDNLTDTIILASANLATKKIALISIPRDLYYNGRKINEYYERYGAQELADVVGEITGVMPDKYVVVDMQSFVDVVDMLGGIDVDVQKNLTDTMYPGANRSYIKVSFKKGVEHMDGARALKYVRSRESTSDFDRSKRQQQVIDIIKKKAEELDLITNIDQITKMYETLNARIKTDISLLEGINYFNTYHTFEISGGNVLSTSNYLYSTHNAGGQYILLPLSGNFQNIQQYINTVVDAT